MVVALKKSDLYSSLWKSADELRGGMDASQYKDYVLTLLFVKYVSDKAKSDPYSLIEVPEGGSFDDLVALKGAPDIGEKMNIAIRRLAEANDLQGVINNADFDDPNKLGEGKAMQDRLTNLVSIFQDIDFTGSRAEGDDLLGDAYEYLMRHFATESGKSKGQFYTPAEVSRIMAQVLEIPKDAPRSTTVYDPACGSGSLLIKVADAAPNGLSIYGQEKDNATWALSRMNMILHGNETHDIRQGDTLSDPKFLKGEQLQTFDYFVANPPFSVKTWKNGFDKEYGRFDGFAEPPEKNGDYAFLLHMVKSLKSDGRGAVILPHGVLFRGNTEAQIREELIRRGLIKAIIGLPANLFYGTGIPACIIVIDKKDAANRTGIFMIDASKGFEKDGPKNRLRPRDMRKIIDTYLAGNDVERYARMVPLSEISDTKNNYNLNIPRYIDTSEPEDIQDLEAHLKGGIPNRDLDALGEYWDAFPNLRDELFRPLREGYSELTVEPDQVSKVIEESEDVRAFASTVSKAVEDWWGSHRAQLEAIDSQTKPQELIEDLGDDLLERFQGRPLISEYSVYEQLMSYWNDTMHDDVTLIVGSGWVDAAQPREARITGYDNKKKPKYERADLVFGTGTKAKRWVMDLIPPALIVDRYFPEEKAEIERLTVEQERISQELQEYIDEHAVEEGLLWEAVNDKGEVKVGDAKRRLKEAKADSAEAEEITALNHVVLQFGDEAAARTAIRNLSKNLDSNTLTQYAKLSPADIHQLVVIEKWKIAVRNGIESEVDGLTFDLTSRVHQLGERYSQTVEDIATELAQLEKRVNNHLKAMGVES
ncbi:N-6 DNA methylase [Corynebacterium striatum]|nr:MULTISPECIES: class I SAM-dependent DNA methyltransferase [Corynebacterium]NHX53153.1 SAM-dependent DNA methyltransferase [Corynebacterium striatum]NHY37765.1 SAM-dependent DNA methyltransferase [Corynebacterium striatum]NHY39213.1 SAM-dependent DNA methyltransferase [Corynebacterium striatum]QRP18273.1 SAM-dependent DNA methyltransferase [Corynebacterium striatum]TXS64129.1 SAM-dependent DNA methyltransferase [Corynebacterium sp. LK14]